MQLDRQIETRYMRPREKLKESKRVVGHGHKSAHSQSDVVIAHIISID